MSRYSKWAQREHRFGPRMALTLLAGILVAILLPFAFVKLGSSADRLLGIQRFDIGVFNYILGGLLLAAGLSLGFWSVNVQMTQGRGTPLPMMPTQELLTRGPFRYCRNPMTFGTIWVYVGICVMAGTVAGIGIALCVIALLLLYLKRMEEKELAERFGEAYLQYKREVPFIIPRLPKGH